MKYTISTFRKDFPDNDTCLNYIFQKKYGNNYECPKCKHKTSKDYAKTFYRVKERKCYACASCGYQIHPTAGTIFHKSRTAARIAKRRK